jgi:hypothetical protein
MASLVPQEQPPQLRFLAGALVVAVVSFTLLTIYCLLRSYIETCWASLTVSSRWGAATTVAWGACATLFWIRRENLLTAAIGSAAEQGLLFLVLIIAASSADAASFQIVALIGGEPTGGWEAMERLLAFAPRAAMMSALVMLSITVWHQRRRYLGTSPEDGWLDFPEAPLLRLRTGDVALIRSAGNYSEIDGAAGTHLVRAPISQLEQRLASCGFVRVHRQTLVNRRHVRALRRDQAGRPVLLLVNGRCVPVGRSYRAQVDALTGAAERA